MSWADRPADWGKPGHAEKGSETEVILDALEDLLDPPRVRMRQTAAQSIPNTTFTALTFGAEDFDTANGHDTVTNNSRYTFTKAGLWVWNGKAAFTANATGQRAFLWKVNNVSFAGSQTAWPAVAAVERQYVAVGFEWNFIVGDYIELCVYQDSGGALNTSVAFAETQSMIFGRWICP
jgi:hypothetical protein